MKIKQEILFSLYNIRCKITISWTYRYFYTFFPELCFRNTMVYCLVRSSVKCSWKWENNVGLKRNIRRQQVGNTQNKEQNTQKTTLLIYVIRGLWNQSNWTLRFTLKIGRGSSAYEYWIRMKLNLYSPCNKKRKYSNRGILLNLKSWTINCGMYEKSG